MKTEHTALGVAGTLTREHGRQFFRAYRPARDPAEGMLLVTLRFDDECRNGHSTFAFTGNTRNMAGCLHDEIPHTFPEFAHLIKWHLCSTDGPMHYVANTLYHADDRDHWGLRKGEFRQIVDRETGLPGWVLEHPRQYADSPDRPPSLVLEWKPWGVTGEGKTRDFAAARRSAVWPDATDEQLAAPRAELEAALRARLPALIADFRATMESLGFDWPVEDCARPRP